jgi:hypothetical protein
MGARSLAPIPILLRHYGHFFRPPVEVSLFWPPGHLPDAFMSGLPFPGWSVMAAWPNGETTAIADTASAANVAMAARRRLAMWPSFAMGSPSPFARGRASIPSLVGGVLPRGFHRKTRSRMGQEASVARYLLDCFFSVIGLERTSLRANVTFA